MNPLVNLILDYLFLANLYVLQTCPQDKVKLGDRRLHITNLKWRLDRAQ